MKAQRREGGPDRRQTRIVRVIPRVPIRIRPRSGEPACELTVVEPMRTYVIVASEGTERQTGRDAAAERGDGHGPA